MVNRESEKGRIRTCLEGALPALSKSSSEPDQLQIGVQIHL